MREIKFRAWDKKNNRMMYWTYGNMSWYPHPTEKNGIPVPMMAFPEFASYSDPMQYTGLKDKNGKEIYEEDILLMPFKKQLVRSSKPGKKNFNVAIEFFPENGWLFQWPKNMGEYQYACGYKNSEVIGNIYENPEILK